jgi:hypothetical protein
VSEQSKVKNVLLIALGGSGHKLGVSLLEKISNMEAETFSATKLNYKLVSVDFGPGLHSGFPMDPQDCLFLYHQGLYLDDLWADFEKKRQHLDVEEPWMQVGTISEIELWLAQDAQQSGIRRVDYELLVYWAQEQIYAKLHETLLTSFPQANASNSEIEVIVLGSLAGRTGSISYPAVCKILNSLAIEFNLKSCHSFLYSPSVFERFYSNDERIVNFLVSTTRINLLLSHADVNVFKPTHFLLDEEGLLLSMHRDWQNQPHQEIPYSETVEMILKLIQLDTSSDNWSASMDNWRQAFVIADQVKLEYLVGSFLAKYNNFNHPYSNHPYKDDLRGSKKVNYKEIFVNLK